jgi:hypothetical protein
MQNSTFGNALVSEYAFKKSSTQDWRDKDHFLSCSVSSQQPALHILAALSNWRHKRSDVSSTPSFSADVTTVSAPSLPSGSGSSTYWGARLGWLGRAPCAGDSCIIYFKRRSVFINAIWSDRNAAFRTKFWLYPCALIAVLPLARSWDANSMTKSRVTPFNSERLLNASRGELLKKPKAFYTRQEQRIEVWRNFVHS